MKIGIPLFVISVVVAIVLIGTLRTGSTAPGTSPAPLVGHAAPLFSTVTASGKRESLQASLGRPVLMNFFATWCIPCRTEMPDIARFYRAHRSALTVLAIDKQEPSVDVRAFARSLRLGFDPLLDPSGSIFTQYHVAVQPVSFWIDGNGIIRAVHYGAMSPQFMKQELGRVLAG